MGDASTANSGESLPEQASESRRMQFRIRTMLLVPLVVVVFVGLAVMVDIAADLVSYRLFGFEWMSSFRRWLIAVGVPTTFVTGYVAFALIRLPGWTALGLTTLLLGLRRSRHAHFLAWLLALAFPLPGIFGSTIPNVQVVAAFGFLVGIGAWSVGWCIRGRFYDFAVERQPTWTSRTIPIAIWTLVAMASTYGWHLLTTVL